MNQSASTRGKISAHPAMALKRLGTDFFLINSPEWEGKMPQDAFFRQHFKVIYSRAIIGVFELNEAEGVPGFSPDRP
jgi:hypothetical protein